MRLKDKVAIVAGAAWGGIGAATAYRFAQEGAAVIVITRSREDKLRETVERIEAIGGQATSLFPVSDEASFATGALLVVDGGLTLQSPEALVRPSFRRRWRDDVLLPE